MKKYFCILLLFLSITSVLCAEDKLFEDLKFTLNEGVSYAQITRIEAMDNRSNFVRENYLIGAFVNFKTEDLWFVDLELQLSAYYPFKTTFNGMQQFPKNPIPYAFDGLLGVTYSFDNLKYIILDFSLGMHYMYQLTDEYHMNYLGLGFQGTMEFPLTKRWTIVNNYFFAYDDANLGSNKGIQNFDASYQYHIDLGVRYSRKVPNAYYYIDIEKIKEKAKNKKSSGEVFYK